MNSGTTIVAYVGKNYIVIGSDKRISAGYSYMGNMSKIEKINKNIYLAFAGSVGDCQNLKNFLKRNVKIFEEDICEEYFVDEILVLIINYLRSSINYVGLILCGKTRDGKLKSYSLDAIGGYVNREVCALGSGRNFAISILEKNYDVNKKLEEAKKIVKNSIEMSSKLDLASGDGICIEVLKF